EVAYCRSDRCSSSLRISERLTNEMLIRASADGNDLARAAGRLKCACSGTAVASRHGYYHARVHRVVETYCKQIVVTMVAAAQRKIQNIHSISDCGIDSVEDVLASRVQYVTGENVVIPQPR